MPARQNGSDLAPSADPGRRVDELTTELIRQAEATMSAAASLCAETAALLGVARARRASRRARRSPFLADAVDRLPQEVADLPEPVAGVGRLRG